MQDIQNEWIGQYSISKPSILYFTMGHRELLRNGDETALGPKEMAHLRWVSFALSSSLFNNIQHIIITSQGSIFPLDIIHVSQLLIGKFPQVKSIQLEGGGLTASDPIKAILNLAQSAKSAGIEFRITLSLNEICLDSDCNWMRDGNCDSAVQAIRTIQNNKINVSVVYTLTPSNCIAADDVLLWCERNGIWDWSFRPAVSVWQSCPGVFNQEHVWTHEQRFHMSLFFEKLARCSGIKLSRRLYYKSLSDQLSFGSSRKAGCVWQSRAISLDNKGEFSFCPPQSPILGSIVGRDAQHVFRAALPIRREILRKACNACLYDAVGDVTTAQLASRSASILASQVRARFRRPVARQNLLVSLCPADRPAPEQWRRILITGWYGTETTGDKAILSEVLHFIKQRSPTCEIIITTLDQKISQQTNKELEDLAGAILVDLDKAHQPALIESVDAVIIGGGPLMETKAMENLWLIFKEANRQRKARIVFGCGIGPLHTVEMSRMTAQVLRMSTAGFFRDIESFEYALKLAPDNKFYFACDPALAYLQRWLSGNPSTKSVVDPSLQIATLLRANTREFITDMAKEGLEDFNQQAAFKIASILEAVCLSRSARATLLAMNAPWIGGDDRMFNRLVEQSFSRPELVQTERGYAPLQTVIQSLASADAAVAMRYHGHLFSMALGIPFISIDYTGQSGKVSNLVRRIGYEQWSESWRELDIQHSAEKLQTLIDDRDYWSKYLKQQSEILVEQLRHTYAEVFPSN